MISWLPITLDSVMRHGLKVTHLVKGGWKTKKEE